MINWIQKKRNKKGFTLIELVVVIAILGILAAIAIPRLTGASNKANWSAHAANIRTIESAISLYQAGGGDIATLNVASETKLPAAADAFVATYMKDWPIKPGNYWIVNGVVNASPTVEATKTATAAATPGAFAAPTAQTDQ